MNKVVVTGIGFASSIGVGRGDVLASLRDLRHGFARRQLPGYGAGPELVCGAVPGFDVSSSDWRDWAFPGAERFEGGFLRALPPHGPFALAALEEALGEAGLARDDLGGGDTGLFCASPGSPQLLFHHLGRMAASGWRRADPLGIVSSVAGTLNFNLAAYYGITGANCGFVSACASSSHALGYAFDEIALGRQERMLVVAAEDGSAESLLPFLGMRALSQNPDPDTASRPFDARRDGFVGTGGAAALVLESAGAAHRRGAKALAEMRAWAQASDGFNVAAPHPDGRGIQAAMARCLAAGGASAGEVDWVNAHATSTPAGDRAEAQALKALGFADAEAGALVSSTKGVTGHGLSYAGALEAALCILCLNEGIVPGNAALAEPDPVCDGLRLPVKTERRDLRLALNNSSGFGGANVCRLFAQP
ncbi:MAG: beta-ketoacyl-[acyl-carrier-protein] synthase family protein [Verrucomicrobiales bacterium]